MNLKQLLLIVTCSVSMLSWANDDEKRAQKQVSKLSCKEVAAQLAAHSTGHWMETLADRSKLAYYRALCYKLNTICAKQDKQQ